MSQFTKAYCRRIIKKQIEELNFTYFEQKEVVMVSRTNSIRHMDRLERACETMELEFSFLSREHFKKTDEPRKIELEALLEKVEKGQFEPFCVGCGAPITVKLFEAHASDRCPVCRTNHNNVLSHTAPKRLASENPHDIYTQPMKKSQSKKVA